MTRTKLFSGLLVAVLLCCNSSPASPQERPARSQGARGPRSPAEAAPSVPAVRIEAPPELSPFTPSLVANLRRIRAVSDRRQDDVFMKVGDSSTVSRGFLECFSDPDEVTLGSHDGLRPTLRYFRDGNAGGRDPFRRESLAAAEGWSARHVLTGHPPPLLREVRAIRPRFAFVMNGGNDVEGHDDYQYASRMLRIVELLSEAGVIPVLNSIPPRGDDETADRWVSRYNQVSWAIANALELPYLDYHQVMEGLPRRGLAGDGVHPNIFIEDHRGQACRFHARGLRHGHNRRNLLALRGLDRLRRTVVEGEDAPDPAADEPDGRGTAEAPWTLRTLPFADFRDTSEAGSSRIDAYGGCDAEQDESGRELVYRLRITEPTTIRAMAVGRRDTDVDVHLLRGSASGRACVARDDHEVVHTLSPGTWYVSVDTFVAEGEARAGEVLVLIAPTDGPPPPR
ncbi:MAG TPA: SGNH/GDSL hydrolase family protein [Sandaracinaceae bacterium LLY-WYZ-13_1]|nr:SGNH/GDSL hydrolase family protein [Sandaracinaceae bacterium LLY-WYZ-13_1]